MEQTIANAETLLQQKIAALHDPATAGDPARLHAASVELESAQNPWTPYTPAGRARRKTEIEF